MTSVIDANTTTLPELLAQLREGDTVILTSGEDKHPVARLEAVAPETSRRLGFLEHLNLKIPDSFFDPLPEDELRLWEGQED